MLNIQRNFNNLIINNTNKIFNEIIYNFILIQITNFFFTKFFTKLLFKKNRLIIRLKIINVIVFEQMNIKFHYNQKH